MHPAVMPAEVAEHEPSTLPNITYTGDRRRIRSGADWSGSGYRHLPRSVLVANGPVSADALEMGWIRSGGRNKNALELLFLDNMSIDRKELDSMRADGSVWRRQPA